MSNMTDPFEMQSQCVDLIDCCAFLCTKRECARVFGCGTGALLEVTGIYIRFGDHLGMRRYHLARIDVGHLSALMYWTLDVKRRWPKSATNEPNKMAAATASCNPFYWMWPSAT